MATTTVKIGDRANRRLDALQARVSLRAGKRVTKQTILEGLIDKALDEETLILLTPPRRPLSPKALRAFEDYGTDWGVETREEDIDRILYDEEQ